MNGCLRCEEERRAIARELHDGIGQALTAIGIGAAFVQRHAEDGNAEALRGCARDIAEQSQAIAAQVRGLLGCLRAADRADEPPDGEADSDGSHLLAAIDGLIADWHRRASALRITPRLPARLPRLAPASAQALQRVLQEALLNVWRHADARQVEVDLSIDGPQVSLRITDDGGGRAWPVQQRAGHGLRGMAERAALAGGGLRLLDGPAGLAVELSLPIDPWSTP